RRHTRSKRDWSSDVCSSDLDGSGDVYVEDTENQTIRKVTPSGLVMTLAGLARSSGSADGTGSAARFYYPGGVAVDGSGNVYVAEIGRASCRGRVEGGGVGGG